MRYWQGWIVYWILDHNTCLIHLTEKKAWKLLAPLIVAQHGIKRLDFNNLEYTPENLTVFCECFDTDLRSNVCEAINSSGFRASTALLSDSVETYHQNILDLTARVRYTAGQWTGVTLPIIWTVIILILVPVPVIFHATTTQLQINPIFNLLYVLLYSYTCNS